MIGFLAFVPIFVTMVLSFFGAPWWSAVLAGVVLASISVTEQQRLRPRFVAVGATEMLTMSALSSLATSCFVTAAAFGLGRAFSWVLSA